MLQQFTIKEKFIEKISKSITEKWIIENNKVFHLKTDIQTSNIRDFYENIGNMIGSFKMFGEDVHLGDRSKQKANKTWMEVRYDSSISNAYRHSSSPQPLHTDGSYIPNFPNASIMCCISNTASGGETIFLDLKKLKEILEQDDPELLEFLLIEDIIHERSGYINKKKILYFEDDKLKINFNYFCISKKNSKENLMKVEKFFNYINSSEKIKEKIFDIKLNAGEAVFWKDSEILHGRNGFLPKKDSDRFLWKAAIDINR